MAGAAVTLGVGVPPSPFAGAASHAGDDVEVDTSNEEGETEGVQPEGSRNDDIAAARGGQQAAQRYERTADNLRCDE